MTDVPMIPTTINGRWDLLLPEHRAVRPEWVTGWEPERIDALHEAITSRVASAHIDNFDGDTTLEFHRGPVVFDIGAEEGDMTALYALWGATVVAFEPNPLVWPNIRAIWDANSLRPLAGHFVGFASNVTDEQPAEIEPLIAAPDRGGWPECAYGPLIGDHGFRNQSERGHDTPQIRLDDFVASRGGTPWTNRVVPDIITIDVEGAELEVLRGARNILDAYHPTLFISVHPEFIYQNYGEYEHDLHKFLRDLGYVGEWLAYDHEHHWRYQHVGVGS